MLTAYIQDREVTFDRVVVTSQLTPSGIRTLALLGGPGHKVHMWDLGKPPRAGDRKVHRGNLGYEVAVLRPFSRHIRLSDDDVIRRLAARMKDALKTRPMVYGFEKYDGCFTGCDAVNWMKTSRIEAEYAGLRSLSVIFAAGVGIGTCKLHGLLENEDTQVMLRFLNHLGATMEWVTDKESSDTGVDGQCVIQYGYSRVFPA